MTCKICGISFLILLSVKFTYKGKFTSKDWDITVN